jgi:LAO/AO transport system kinase
MKSALAMLHPTSAYWQPPVMTLSALQATGIAEFWRQVENFKDIMTTHGEWSLRRQRQALAWMWAHIDSGLRSGFRNAPEVRRQLPEIVQKVEEGKVPPTLAARQLLSLMHY